MLSSFLSHTDNRSKTTVKNPIPKMKASARRVKSKLDAAYQKDPEQFMLNTAYAVGIALMVAGGVARLGNQYASYKSKTAYARIMNESMKRRGY